MVEMTKTTTLKTTIRLELATLTFSNFLII